MLRMGHSLAAARMQNTIQAMTGSESQTDKAAVTLEQYKSWIRANQPTASMSSLLFFIQTSTMVGSQNGLTVVRVMELVNLSVAKATKTCLAPDLPLVSDLFQVLSLPLGSAVLMFAVFQCREFLKAKRLIEMNGHHFWRSFVNLNLFIFAPVTRMCAEMLMCRPINGTPRLVTTYSNQ
jgi:hypothetical protein